MELVRSGDNKVTIKPEGRIDVVNSQTLKQELLNLFNEGINEIIIDFSKITSIDSSGLGKLLLFQKKLKERGGELSIVNVTNDYIQNMFKMIHLNKVIKIENM
ncbi:STAS domain-containing protein [Anaerobacillus isosaccharinicus]|uniref:Anti-sigma factor antagonist n=1 Tax=Anaerobacillus isosaccharinicus TaxID=1532552 RepID=A0A1S2LF42_9BACI|nr:STAS domain-containing protein [Anaerobacillus isosaccharinicus]MBA5587772.1 STAS domain-containing protein [Anaerobacillus isosaccharinicus]QOY34070.1 STAS domain-containing protein [Anaerobacillus isosaccharinicus]